MVNFTRLRLEKLLGMLGSEFENERAVAALKIANMAKDQGKTIVELCTFERTVEKVAGPRVYEKPKPKFRDHDDTDAHSILTQIQDAVNRERVWFVKDEPVWTEWEREFMTDLLRRYWNDDEMSDRQLEIVARVAGKLQQRESEPLI